MSITYEVTFHDDDAELLEEAARRRAVPVRKMLKRLALLSIVEVERQNRRGHGSRGELGYKPLPKPGEKVNG